jgi:hypothetical protein
VKAHHDLICLLCFQPVEFRFLFLRRSDPAAFNFLNHSLKQFNADGTNSDLRLKFTSAVPGSTSTNRSPPVSRSTRLATG